jgi:hypothetical protein
MRASGSSHLDATVEMKCEHCGATEALPGDAERRVLALRALLVERRWAEDAASGPALGYLRMMERAGPVVTPYLFGAFLVVATVLHGAVMTPWTVVPLGVVGGAGVASYLALRVCRRRLRAVMAPLLRAAPGAPGRPQRCRRCGGELPAGDEAFRDCGFCSAPNLASNEGAVELAGRLRAGAAAGHAQAAAAAPHLEAAARFVVRTFRAAFLIGVVAGGLAARLVFAAATGG